MKSIVYLLGLAWLFVQAPTSTLAQPGSRFPVPGLDSALTNRVQATLVKKMIADSLTLTRSRITNQLPINTNQLINGAGFITAATAPVTSVNGQTGPVTINGTGPAFIKLTDRLLVPPKLFFIAGTPLPVYKSSLIADNGSLLGFKTALVEQQTAGQYAQTGASLTNLKPPRYRYFTDDIQLQGELLYPTVSVAIAQAGTGENYSVPISVTTTAPASLSGVSLRLHQIGDSKTAFGVPTMLKNYLASYGATTTLMGIVPNTGNYGEGRVGWKSSNYIGLSNQASGVAQIVPSTTSPGSTSANPFLKVATTADLTNHPDWCFRNTGAYTELSYVSDPVKTGTFYIFDYANYLSATGQAAPNVVLLALGVNDLTFDGTATALTQTKLAFTIMASQIKAAVPSVKIGIIPMDGIGTTTQGNTDWLGGAALIESGIQLAQTLNTTVGNVDVVPIWAHMNRDFSFPYGTPTSLTATSSEQVNSISDRIHFSQYGRAEYANAAAAYVAYALNATVSNPAALTATALAVAGATSLNEGATANYTVTATYSNGSTADVTSQATFSVSGTGVSVAGATLTAATNSTQNDTRMVSLTVTYGGLSQPYSVTVVDTSPPPSLTVTSVTIAGANSINEGSSATYTATATFNDNSTLVVTNQASYTLTGSGATLSGSTVTVASNQTAGDSRTATLAASYGGKTGTFTISIVDTSPTLTDLALTGPSSINEGSSGTYAAIATYSNSTTANVSASAVLTAAGTGATVSGMVVSIASNATQNDTRPISLTLAYGGLTRTYSVTAVDTSPAPAVTPTLASAKSYYSGLRLVTRWSSALSAPTNATATASHLTVSGTYSTTVTNVALDATDPTILYVELSTAPSSATDVVSLAYDGAGGLAGTSANTNVAAFSGQSITNNFQNAALVGRTIKLNLHSDDPSVSSYTAAVGSGWVQMVTSTTANTQQYLSNVTDATSTATGMNLLLVDGATTNYGWSGASTYTYTGASSPDANFPFPLFVRKAGFTAGSSSTSRMTFGLLGADPTREYDVLAMESWNASGTKSTAYRINQDPLSEFIFSVSGNYLSYASVPARRPTTSLALPVKAGTEGTVTGYVASAPKIIFDFRVVPGSSGVLQGMIFREFLRP